MGFTRNKNTVNVRITAPLDTKLNYKTHTKGDQIYTGNGYIYTRQVKGIQM